MSNTILILIGIHILLNGMITGYYFAEHIKDDWRGWVDILVIFLAVVFGVEFVILSFVIHFVITLFKHIFALTQLPFYFNFYLTKSWNKENFTKEHLKNLDMRWEAFQGKEKLSLSDRHFLFTIDLINKRVGRKPKLQKVWQEEEDAIRIEAYNKSQLKKWQGYFDTVKIEKISKCPSCGTYKSPPQARENSCYWCGYNQNNDNEE